MGEDTNENGTLDDSEVTSDNLVCSPTTINDAVNFRRIGFFPSCAQIDPNCNTDVLSNADIIDVSSDGQTLVYVDSARRGLGFIDISDPSNPQADGFMPLNQNVASVAVRGNFALVTQILPRDDFSTNGNVAVIDIAARSLSRSIELGGEPDSIAVSPDQNFAAVAVENEGNATQDPGGELPFGFVMIINTQDDDPASWTTQRVAINGPLSGDLNGTEPEFVDINEDNIIAVTLQENNRLVLIDAASGNITLNVDLGSTNLTGVDLDDERPRQIQQNETSGLLQRQPDAVAWVNSQSLVTVNEGDRDDSGTRDFTVFDLNGEELFTAGNSLDQAVAGIGHYPDRRSDEQGNEPESADVGVFGDERFLFVSSERSSVVFVYNIADAENPVLKQILPAATSPEGVKAIPERSLLAVASEEDIRGEYRAGVTLYDIANQSQSFPHIQSVDRADGTPIPWGAISGITGDLSNSNAAYSIEDGFFGFNRILEFDLSTTPITLSREIQITDPNALIDDLPIASTQSSGDVFDGEDRDELRNADGTINLDFEGIAQVNGGGFWLAAEGDGTVGSPLFDPIDSRNRIFQTDANGVIVDIISLPNDVDLIQRDEGFSGIAQIGNRLVVPFEAQWNNEVNVRLGIYDLGTDTWSFVFYPLENIISQNGGTIGLYGAAAIDDDNILILERDDQGGPDAALKRLYRVNLAGVNDGDIITKTLERDLIPSGDLDDPGGQVLPFYEGVTINADGNVLIINDNNGTEDGNGETRLINLGALGAL